MPDLRLIASDIDGTLADDQGELAPETIVTLRALLRRGMSVVLVTGLNPWAVRRYLAHISGEDSFPELRAIALNGIFLLEGEALHEGRFTPPEVIRDTIPLLLEEGHVPLVFGADGVTRYVPVPAGMATVEALVASRPYQPFVQVADVAELLATPAALVSMTGSAEAAARVAERLQAVLGERAYIVHQPGLRRSWVEVNHREARKDVALLALAARLGFTPEEILYFGDSLNDLPVFEKVPHVVAVENARPEIKARAWRLAPPNHAAGVARFLQELFGVREG